MWCSTLRSDKGAVPNPRGVPSSALPVLPIKETLTAKVRGVPSINHTGYSSTSLIQLRLHKLKEEYHLFPLYDHRSLICLCCSVLASGKIEGHLSSPRLCRSI